MQVYKPLFYLEFAHLTAEPKKELIYSFTVFFFASVHAMIPPERLVTVYPSLARRVAAIAERLPERQ